MNILKVIFILLMWTVQSQATDVVIPTTYQTNGTVTATNLNGNFTAIAQKINGGLDNDNADTTNGFRFYEVKATLPSAGSQGRTVFLTSNNSLNFDTGSAWVAVQTAGILMPSGAVFFMASGACPTGSTDISVTYANKFVKINSTQLTSSGTVLTGTTGSTVLDITQIPAHTHTVDRNITGAAFGNTAIASSNNATIGATTTTSSAGGGLGHTHTLSGATTLEPSSITMKACQVN